MSHFLKKHHILRWNSLLSLYDIVGVVSYVGLILLCYSGYEVVDLRFPCRVPDKARYGYVPTSDCNSSRQRVTCNRCASPFVCLFVCSCEGGP